MLGGERGEDVSEHTEHFWFLQFLLWKKIYYFHGWGARPPPFAENSAKIINLIFEPFPKVVRLHCDHIGKKNLFEFRG